jgi:hypothetical protein
MRCDSEKITILFFMDLRTNKILSPVDQYLKVFRKCSWILKRRGQQSHRGLLRNQSQRLYVHFENEIVFSDIGIQTAVEKWPICGTCILGKYFSIFHKNA